MVEANRVTSGSFGSVSSVPLSFDSVVGYEVPSVTSALEPDR